MLTIEFNNLGGSHVQRHNIFKLALLQKLESYYGKLKTTVEWAAERDGKPTAGFCFAVVALITDRSC